MIRMGGGPVDKSVVSPMLPVTSIYPGHRFWVRFYRGHVYKNTEHGDDIHHWHLHSHNFFDLDENREKDKYDKTYLAFTDPDYEILQMDKCPKYAMDPRNPVQIRPILNFARWKQIKFKPNSFIARNCDQIKEALSHIKYCMVENGPGCESSGPGCKSSGPCSSSGEDPEQNVIRRPLIITYPTESLALSNPALIHEEAAQKRLEHERRLDIMASSPLGCLQSVVF